MIWPIVSVIAVAGVLAFARGLGRIASETDRADRIAWERQRRAA
jgi:hypothetical protein